MKGRGLSPARPLARARSFRRGDGNGFPRARARPPTVPVSWPAHYPAADRDTLNHDPGRPRSRLSDVGDLGRAVPPRRKRPALKTIVGPWANMAGGTEGDTDRPASLASRSPRDGGTWIGNRDTPHPRTAGGRRFTGQHYPEGPDGWNSDTERRNGQHGERYGAGKALYQLRGIQGHPRTVKRLAGHPGRFGGAGVWFIQWPVWFYRGGMVFMWAL